MNDPIKNILTDLPKLQQIALRPRQQNPLLELILLQAHALDEIARWAGSAHQLAAQASADADEPNVTDLGGRRAG